MSTYYLGLQELIRTCDPDIVGVTEHWQSQEQIKMYGLEGYELISIYCREFGHHGWSALFANKDYVFSERMDLQGMSVPKV